MFAKYFLPILYFQLVNITIFEEIYASLIAQRLKRLPGTRETWVQSLDQEDPLEKEMATHSSILAWRTPWRVEPGRLQSRGHKESDMAEHKAYIEI